MRAACSQRCLAERPSHETPRLFKRLPILSGFWLGPDLKVAELSVFTWPGYTAGADLYDALMQSVVEFAEEHPEAVQLIRGRTFARAVH